jgi:hypothetical protein
MHEQLESYNRGMSDAFDDMASGEPISLTVVKTCQGAYWRGYERALQNRFAFMQRVSTGIGELSAWSRFCRRVRYSLIADVGDPRIRPAEYVDADSSSPAPLLIVSACIIGMVALAFFWR